MLTTWLKGSDDNLLLKNYVYSTALEVSAASENNNPFLDIVLPLAYSDNMILHCVLAISGACLLFNFPTLVHDHRMHYGIALRSVKQSLVHWSSKEKDDILILLTASILLCLYEVSLTFLMTRSIQLVRATNGLDSKQYLPPNIDVEVSASNC